MTKISLLWTWCTTQGLFNSNQTRAYGVNNYYTSAHRRVQEWAEAGKLIRLTDTEAKQLGLLKNREQWYATPERYKQLFGVEYKEVNKQVCFI